MRTFADDLRGTYYRCPKCREGVIAVPEEGSWAEPSDEAPAVKEAISDDGRKGRASKTTESESSSGGTTRPPAPPGLDEAPLKKAPTDETPRGAFFGTGPDAHSSEGSGSVLPPASASDVKDPSGEEEPDFVEPAGDTKAVLGSSAGRRPVKVRRILVECALCGYHVAVPPELFGKTVHCPECRADMMFSESSLEPVKDEIIGRIALEHAERRALANPIPGPIPSPATLLRTRKRIAAVVSVLLAVLLVLLLAFAWKLFHGPK